MGVALDVWEILEPLRSCPGDQRQLPVWLTPDRRAPAPPRAHSERFPNEGAHSPMTASAHGESSDPCLVPADRQVALPGE